MKGMSSSAQISCHLDYSEEIKLKIPCVNDDNNIAVLYCADCKTNLCRECFASIHSWKCFTAHKFVRLTKKLESPVTCHLHSESEAKLICKEPNCVGNNKPICIWCHLYDKHKNHKYELLTKQQEHTEETPIITKASLLKEVEAKQKECDKISEVNYRCISSYFESESIFLNSERAKIDKFYSDAKTLALKTLEEFARNRVKTLLPLQEQCERDKIRLDNIRKTIQSIEQPETESTEELMAHEPLLRFLSSNIAETCKKPGDTVPFEDCNIKYPSIELININIDCKLAYHTDITQPKIKQKDIAVYYFNCSSLRGQTPLPSHYFGLRDVSRTDKKNDGTLYTYNNGRSIFSFIKKPSKETIDTSKYDYVAVIELTSRAQKAGEIIFKVETRNKWCSRIMVLIDSDCSEYKMEFVNDIKRLAENDKRIEVVEYSVYIPIDALLLSK